ncbi:MAG: lysophospholipid acyltransferase family protein [Polyangiaceae bacterium]
MQPVRALFHLIATWVSWLPWSVLRELGAALGWLVGSVVRVRRREVVDRIERAGFHSAELVASAMYTSLGTGLFELLAISADTRPIASRVELTERAREVFERIRHRGAIVATAHTGCWDLVGCAMAELAPLCVVTKRLSVGSLDRVWQASRRRRGIRLIEARGALAAARDAMSRGELVVFPIDQVPERDSGVLIHPFLGHLARHDMAPALLAARLRVPLVLALGRRVGEKHVIDVRLVADPRDAHVLRDESPRSWIVSTTRRAADALGEFIREEPAQWLWLHRRWKGVVVDTSK